MTDEWLGLQGRTVLLTGAAGGLGSSMARSFGQAGANVVLADSQFDGVQRLAQEMSSQGMPCLPAMVDVRRQSSIDEALGRARERFGGVDVLVNNAGIYPSRPWHEVTEEEWDDVLAVNLKGYFLCAKSVYPDMRARRWGRIINISSVTFFLGFPLLVHYVSTKGGIVGLTRALAREVGADNITVNSIAPGAFPTAAELIHPDQEGYNRYVLENQSIKRRGEPEDVANAALFLASAAAGFITGQTLLVDGGWAMH